MTTAISKLSFLDSYLTVSARLTALPVLTGLASAALGFRKRLFAEGKVVYARS